MYDGEVNLVPGTGYRLDEYGIAQPVSRSGIVLHELEEIYLRTHEGKSYDQAHPEAGGIGELIHFIVE